MKQNLTEQLSQKVTGLFQKYLGGKIDATLMVRKLNALKRPTKSGKTLWFRFFTNDTGATTTNDLLNDLTTGFNTNGEYRRECMEIAVDTGSVAVYFS